MGALGGVFDRATCQCQCQTASAPAQPRGGRDGDISPARSAPPIRPWTMGDGSMVHPPLPHRGADRSGRNGTARRPVWAWLAPEPSARGRCPTGASERRHGAHMAVEIPRDFRISRMCRRARAVTLGPPSLGVTVRGAGGCDPLHCNLFTLSLLLHVKRLT